MIPMSDTTDSNVQKAPLNPRWRMKLGIIAFIVFLVGCWGLWDATSVYPNRGKKFADWAKWQYLEESKKADDEDFGIFLRDSSVTDPEGELERLNAPDRLAQNRADAGNPGSSRSKRASMQNARLQWLDSLKVVGMLDAANTTIESPQRELEALREKWSATSTNPKPLSSFDLMSQWLIMGVCYFVTLIMVVHMMRVASQRYSWAPDSMTLTIPGGASITPDDLEEIDKRKWDKFIVFLKLKDAHPKLGGQEIKVDTYQRLHVEDWILAMEEQAFPSQEDEDAPSDPESTEPEPDATGDDTSDA
jgi:hypothetical protein